MLTSMYVHIMKLSPSIVTRPSEDIEKSDGPASRNNTVYLLFMMIILSLFNIYNIFITSTVWPSITSVVYKKTLLFKCVHIFFFIQESMIDDVMKGVEVIVGNTNKTKGFFAQMCKEWQYSS